MKWKLLRGVFTGVFIVGAAVVGTFALLFCIESRTFADHLSQATKSVQSAAQFNPFATNAKETRKKKVTVFVPEYREVEVVVSEREQRSQEYSDLMLLKAQRMSEDELNEAITTVKADLAAQDEAAQTELDQAIEILEQLVEQSGGTPAADRAGLALPFLKGQMPQPPPTEPTPAPFFTPSDPTESVPTY